MASLTLSTNWSGSEEEVHRLLTILSSKVAFLTGLSEEELLIELRTNVYISFCKSSTELAAHGLWAFGGNADKWQNSELHRTISAVLEKTLSVPPSRLRITRVQLYEILDHESRALPLSARREPRSPTSPRSPKEKEKKKSWSKSLDRKKASDLTKEKQKKLSNPAVDYTDNMKSILAQDESETSSDVSGTR